MADDINEWFIQNVLVHESALTRFLWRVWVDRSEVDDLRHEIYARVLQAAMTSPPSSPKAFLFATARHLIADRARRNKVVSIELREDLDSLNVLIDELSPERYAGTRQELLELVRAFEALPSSCRDIMWMVRVEELTQKQIAERLHLTVRAVEKRIAHGLRLLRQALLEQGKPLDTSAARTNAKPSSKHG